MSAYVPGTPVYYLETADGTTHPGTVAFDFCDLSEEGPYTMVWDEVGWGHTCHADWLSPASGDWVYGPRPPGPRKTETR